MISIRTVASLILAIAIAQLAQGLLAVQLPISMQAEHLSETAVGFVTAAYALGFMAGAWLGPAYLARIGNIRVFAASAAIAAATTLTLHWADGVLLWMVNRFATGSALALLFIAGESWMSGSIAKAERGNVLGFYQVCLKATMAIGPFLIAGAPPGASEPLMTAAILFAMALVPICFTSRVQPEHAPKPQPIALRAQLATAPAAVIACFSAGLINGAVMALAPLYAQERFGVTGAAGFIAAAWIGSLIVQWPAGLLSDRVDRRLVIAGLVGPAAAAALALAVFDRALSLPAASLLFALWGAGTLSFYGIAVAHMADRAETGQLARATSGLLFAWAIGSVAGPPILGLLSDIFSTVAVFWYASVLGALLAASMFWRRARRDMAETETKAHYSEKPTTSVAVADIAYGDEADGQQELKL